MSEFIAWFGVFFLGIFIGISGTSLPITPSEWAKASEHCSTNEGIEKMVVKTLDDNVVVCKNQGKFILKGDGK